MITDKQAMLDHVQTDRRQLEKYLSRLTPEQMEQPGVVGEWSVKDVLAHLADWERLCITWIEQWLQGKTPQVPAPGFTWKDLDRINQQIYERNCRRGLQDVLGDFHSVHQHLIDQYAALSDEQCFTRGYFPWTGNATFARWASAYAAHDRWGKTHIRQWMKDKKFG